LKQGGEVETGWSGGGEGRGERDYIKGEGGKGNADGEGELIVAATLRGGEESEGSCE